MNAGIVGPASLTLRLSLAQVEQCCQIKPLLHWPLMNMTYILNRNMGKCMGWKMQADVDSLKLGWQFLSNGNPVHKQHGKSFVDPSEALSTRVWKFRTTIVLVGAVWEVVEHSKALDGLSELTADIPGILIPTTIDPHFSSEAC